MALKGKTALVTGGFGGIGIATAKKLLHEGANVAICDVPAAGDDMIKELQKEFGAQYCIFVPANVCDDAEIEGAFAAVKTRFNKLDIVVNCAGICNDFKWNLEVDVNLKGVIRGSLLAWKHMGKDSGGSGGTVVNVASAAGLIPFATMPIYTATKHAVVGLSRSCGEKKNFDRTGVRVITICPGGTATQILEPKQELHQLSEVMAEEWNELLNRVHRQSPENVAESIVHVILHGASGSVWVVTDDEPAFQVKIPSITEMRVSE